MLAVRITYPYEEIKTALHKIADYCDKFVVYEHEASQVHIHCLIVNPSRSTDSMKDYIKQVKGKVSRDKWSWLTEYKDRHDENTIKPVNEGQLTYMSKGRLVPKFVKGYTSEEIEAYRLKWVEYPKEKIQYKLRYEKPADAKIRINDMLDQVSKRFNHPDNKKSLIELLVLVVCKEHKCVVGRYKLRDYYDTLQARHNTENYIDVLQNIFSYK